MPSDAEKHGLKPHELIIVERAELLKAKKRRAQQEALRDFHEEERAEKLDLDVRADGMVFRGRHQSNIPEAKREIRLSMLFLEPLIELTEKAKDFVVASVGLSGAFASNAAHIPASIARNGEQISFEEMAVTQATQQEIERDQAILSAKIEEFQEMNRRPKQFEPGERMAFGRKIIRLAEEFDMMRVPKTAIFIASIEKVEALEAEAKRKDPEAECTGLVCVFRREARNGINSRGVGYGVDISDVFSDDNAAEVKLTEKEKSADIKTAPSRGKYQHSGPAPLAFS